MKKYLKKIAFTLVLVLPASAFGVEKIYKDTQFHRSSTIKEVLKKVFLIQIQLLKAWLRGKLQIMILY